MTDREMVDIPRDHRITSKPVGNATLTSVSADGENIKWNRDFGLHHYTCSCGESFEGRSPESQILEHLLDVGVLDWDDVDPEVIR